MADHQQCGRLAAERVSVPRSNSSRRRAAASYVAFSAYGRQQSSSDHGHMMAATSAASSAAVSVWIQVCIAWPSVPSTQVDGLLPSPGLLRNDPLKPRAATG